VSADLVCAACGARGEPPRIIMGREQPERVTLRPAWLEERYQLVCDTCRDRLKARPVPKVRREP
jgi:hypothetical protein